MARLPIAALPFLILAAATPRGEAAPSANLLRNPTFSEGTDARGVPIGWQPYGGGQGDLRLSLAPLPGGGQALLIEDGNPALEVGVTQAVAVTPGETYQASAWVRSAAGATTSGAYLQLRFHPSERFVQAGLATQSTAAAEEISVKATAPPDTRSATVYLYTHRDPTPRVLVERVALVSGVPPPPPPPPSPAEVTPPVYTKLKDLRLATDLVRAGRPNAAIVAPASGVYREQAARIQEAVRALTGAALPIVADDAPEAALPLTGHRVALGNRSTNRFIEELYNRYFTLLDLRYPGPEGYEVRTLHNPFGGGHNVVLVGGSDAKGVDAAASALVAKLRAAGGKQGELSLGWLMEIRLGKGVRVPTDLSEFEVWEASAGYRSVGYFGWNSISKRMAMYYMTGDPFHAREALRLSFPDAKALEEITRIDEERLENKKDPLAGPYHYNAHLMILFWDLIEESPVFTDAERLRVTNAFSRQLEHRKNEGIFALTQAPGAVGSRHGQWSAVSLYSLGRYFQRDYPNPIWQQCVEGARWAFAPLREHAWVSGENDNLFWYSTAIAPIFTYLALSGEREPVRNGILRGLFQGQEILVSGRRPDWALNSAALDYLHKAAYLFQDGRPLLYRDRTGINTGVFRLGQSYWPDERLKPSLPDDLVGKWSINALPRPQWVARRNGFPFEESFYFGSFRSAPDESGDFVLLDGFNGASRNPYHTFALLELRLNGSTLLQGYRNQVLTRADGMVEPEIAMDAALRYRDVVGQTAAAVGEVPRAAFCNWRRTLAQRIGRYALVVDDLTFRTDSENIEVQTLWEGPGASWRASENAIRSHTAANAPLPAGWRRVRSLDTTVTTEPAGAEMLARLDSLGIVVLRATDPGAWMELAFTLEEPFTGEVYADFLDYDDRGKARLFLDGKPVGPEYDNYASAIETERVSLGRHQLGKGDHRLRVQASARRPESDRCYVGLAGLSLQPDGALPASSPAAAGILPCDVLSGSTTGGVTTVEWRGAVKQGQHRVFFSLVIPEPAKAAPAGRCLRLADNAAALALPSPAVAVTGSYEGTEAELAIVAEDHLYGRALRRAGADAPLVSSTAPVDLDWEFASGQLQVVASADTTLSLGLASPTGLRVDGKPAAAAPAADGLFAVAIPAGRHALEGARPAPGATQRAGARLQALLARADQERQRLLASRESAQPATAAAAISPALTAAVGGKVVDLIPIPSAQGPLLAAAEGQTMHILTPEGKEVRRLAADGPIRRLHWWPEYRLLLAGCADEKVIAFDEAGARKWVFVSQMDPAVFEAAKQYWFKSAPGHEGIHGLDTGTFLDGKSQCFVGSACTLEILDGDGKLVKRLPVFWGTGSLFRIVEGPNGSLNLLIGRSRTDGAHLAIVNNRDLRVTGGGFNSVPAGATFVGGWASMNRSHLFYEDLDGDGVRELASEINGTWNRVTVWKADGTPLFDASFGPGASIPAQNLRALDVADLNGDGKKEILVATANGLVVALDHQCRKLWARRLEAPPTVLKAVSPKGGGAPRIVVGCEGGRVVVMDGAGAVLRAGSVGSTPTRLVVLETAESPVAVLGTERGEVRGVRIR